jgi:hypothetical protein
MVVAAERTEAKLSGDADLLSTIRRTVYDNCGLYPASVLLLDRGVLLKSTSGKISRAASVRKLQAARSEAAV